MSLFKKRENDNGKTELKMSERNEINNKDLKEALGNTALSILQAGKDYTELLNTIVKFGYVFTIEGRGIEALLKVKTDKGIFYFAVQKSEMVKLNFNFTEEHFIAHTDTFLEIHS